MPALGVNIDHVATLRQARKSFYPDPVRAALLCEKAGADSIVCHLREDRRHIQDDDLKKLKKSVKVKLNLEMAASEEIIKIALGVKPDQITLVPEKREELTTEGGLDVASLKKRMKEVIKVMRKAGIAVSFFIDPEKEQIEASVEAGAKMIELHTGRYAEAGTGAGLEREYEALSRAAKHGAGAGLSVFAGHGLNYKNTDMLTKIKEITEYNIGHSIIAHSVFVGIENAVKEMKRLVR